jgi:hypothetical protein
MFGANDGAAAPSTPAVMVPAPMPDTADVAAVPMLKAGAVVGLILSSPVASGDTVQLQVFKNGTVMSGINVTNSNATPQAVAMFSKDTAAAQFVAGDLISARYLTTTGGTYTAHDILAIAVVQYGLSE